MRKSQALTVMSCVGQCKLLPEVNIVMILVHMFAYRTECFWWVIVFNTL